MTIIYFFFRLKVDRQNINMPKNVWKCDKCDKTYTLKQTLNTHKNRKHREVNHVCPTCNAQFNDKSTWKRHVRFQRCKDKSKILNCETCGMLFRKRYNLKRHIETHHSGPTEPFNCDKCEKIYYSSAALRLHKKEHITVKISTAKNRAKQDKADLDFACSSTFIEFPDEDGAMSMVHKGRFSRAYLHGDACRDYLVDDGDAGEQALLLDDEDAEGQALLPDDGDAEGQALSAFYIRLNEDKSKKNG